MLPEDHTDPPVAAYLVLSHQRDGRLTRLLQTIRHRDPQARIYLDHNVEAASAITPAVRDLVDFLSFSPGARGDFSPVERTLKMMRAALQDPDMRYLTLLSGEDYPCADLVQMRRDLARTPDGFLQHFPMLPAQSPTLPLHEARSRYLYSWRSLVPLGARTSRVLRPIQAINYCQPWVRVNTAFGSLKVGVHGNAPPTDVRLVGGSFWFSLSRAAVHSALRTVQDRPDLVAWAHRANCVDEAFFQTVLANDPDLRFVNDSKRYVDFSRTSQGRPAYLDLASLPQIRASKAYFCRKVASPELMDALDQETGNSAP